MFRHAMLSNAAVFLFLPLLLLLSSGSIPFGSGIPPASAVGGGVRGPVLAVDGGFQVHPPANMLEQFQMRFTENRGQIADSDGNPRPDILYTARSGGARMYFTRDGVSTVFTRRRPADVAVSEATGRFVPKRGSGSESPRDVHAPAPGGGDVYEGHRVNMTFDGCNPDVRVSHRSPLPGYENFYFPHCPEGITGVPAYRQLVYEELYEDVDLRYYSADARQYKYEFTVRPGGDPSRIALRFDGADRLYVDVRGDLHVVTALGEEVHRAPESFTADGSPVASAFVVRGDRVTFAIGDYDREQTLVIDPWGMYVGGNDTDWLGDVAVTHDNRIAAVGVTGSTDFPTTGGYQRELAGGSDIYAAVFSQEGKFLWGTFIGGESRETGRSIACTTEGDFCLLGITSSANFPTKDAWQPEHAGGNNDFVVAKLSSDGELLWSTYCGGSGYESTVDMDFHSCAIAVSPRGDIYFAGITQGAAFPVLHPYQAAPAGKQDCILAKFHGNGQAAWITFLGGAEDDRARGVMADAEGNVYVVGATGSANFPVSRAYQNKRAGFSSDMFVSKFTPECGLIWSTYFGGNSGESATNVCLDTHGACTVVGITESKNMPVKNPLQDVHAGGYDGAIVRFDSSGSLDCATYIGGSADDRLEGVTHTPAGKYIITGVGSGSSFPTMNALQDSANGSQDAVIALLDYFEDNGFSLNMSTYLGTPEYELAPCCATDLYGNVIVGINTRGNFCETYEWFSGYNTGETNTVLLQLTPAGTLRTEATRSRLRSPHQVILYPQPSHGEVAARIQISSTDVIALDLCDLLGRRIARLHNDRKLAPGEHVINLPLPPLSPGVYFIQLTGSRSKAVTKLLIQ